MGFVDRLHNAWKIFATSFRAVGTDKSLLIVPFLTIFLNIALFIPVVIIATSISVQVSLIATVIIFFILMHILNTFLGSMHAWMVHEVLEGKDTTLFSGFKRAVREFKDILLYALVFSLIKAIIGSIRNKGGGAGHFIGGFLDLIAGIAGRLVLPAMIITEKTFGQSMKQLKHALKTAPEIGTYEVGIRPINSFLFLIGFLIVWALTSVSVTAAIVFGAIYLLLFMVLNAFINNTFYTILYIAAIEKRKVKGLDLKL